MGHAVCRTGATPIPAGTAASCPGGYRPTGSVNTAFSIATIDDSFATDSGSKPEWQSSSLTFARVTVHFRLLINRTHTVVEIRLRLKESIAQSAQFA